MDLAARNDTSSRINTHTCVKCTRGDRQKRTSTMATTTEFRAANTDSPLRSSFSVSLSSLSKCLLALVSFIYLCEQSRSRPLFYLRLNVSVCEIAISIKRYSTMFIDSRNMRYLFVPGPDSLKIRY